MRMIRGVVRVALSLLATGCAAPLAASGEQAPRGAASFDETNARASLALDAEGRSALFDPVLADADGGPAALALWTRMQAGRCFRLAAPGGEAPLPALGQGAALFVLAPPPRQSLRFELLDCLTRRPSQPDDGLSVELGWQVRESIPSRGSVAIRFVVSRRSMLFGRPDLRGELIAALADELSAASLDVWLAEDASVELAEEVAPALRFGAATLGELEALRALGGTSPRATIDVIIAGCLRYDDPSVRAPVELQGFTPRVGGGGGGPADAVFLPGTRCDSFRPGPEPWPIPAYAHVLAHELGHFLGLGHTVEADGRTDALEDTSEENTMHFRPELASSRGLSRSQGRILRSHPWVAAVPR